MGITERAALSILRLLEEEGIISRIKEGRRNRYWVDFEALFRHEVPGPYNIGELAAALMAIADRMQAAVAAPAVPPAAAPEPADAPAPAATTRRSL